MSRVLTAIRVYRQVICIVFKDSDRIAQ